MGASLKERLFFINRQNIFTVNNGMPYIASFKDGKMTTDKALGTEFEAVVISLISSCTNDEREFSAAI